MEVISYHLLLAGEQSSTYLQLLNSIRSTRQPQRMVCQHLSLMQLYSKSLRLNIETILKFCKECLFSNNLSHILIRHLMKCSNCLRRICSTQRRLCLSSTSAATLIDLNVRISTSYSLERINHSKIKYQLLTKSY